MTLNERNCAINKQKNQNRKQNTSILEFSVVLPKQHVDTKDKLAPPPPPNIWK